MQQLQYPNLQQKAAKMIKRISNVKQSKIAIGSGGFFGKGFLKGTQTQGDFVPEQNTDFIFTSVGEKFWFCRMFHIDAALFWVDAADRFIAERQQYIQSYMPIR